MLLLLSVDARVPQDVLHVPGVQAPPGQHDLLRLTRRRDLLQVVLRQELRAPRVGSSQRIYISDRRVSSPFRCP